MVVNIAYDLIDHNHISDIRKVLNLFNLWINCHSFERKPRLTPNRINILSTFIQTKGYDQCIITLKFLSSEDPHAAWLRDNNYTKFENIFHTRKWDKRYDRAFKYLNKE
jgi:hypothetical protein